MKHKLDKLWYFNHLTPLLLLVNIMGRFAVSASCWMVETKPRSSQRAVSTSSKRIRVLVSPWWLAVISSLQTCFLCTPQAVGAFSSSDKGITSITPQPDTNLSSKYAGSFWILKQESNRQDGSSVCQVIIDSRFIVVLNWLKWSEIPSRKKETNRLATLQDFHPFFCEQQISI